MKPSRKILASSVLIAASSIAAHRASLKAAGPGSSASTGGYAIDLQHSQAAGRSTWRYTIDKTTLQTKDLGHFILDLDSCGSRGPTLANIVSATVDGIDWAERLEASEGRTGCDVTSQNFVKFDELPAADSHVVEFTL